MINKSTLLNFICVVLSVFLVVCVVYLYLDKPRIAYVRSQQLVEKFQGTIEARGKFESSKSSLTANVDSLKLNFERSRTQYINNAARMSVSQRQQQEKMLGQQQGQLIQYSEAINQKIQEEDQKMMQEVLNQINSFVEEYAKAEGYDMILGTTLSGSLLYGKEAMDITTPLLEKLNERYKKGK